MASGHALGYKRNKLTTKSPHQHPSDRVFSESPSSAGSQHLVEAGLTCSVAAAAAAASSSPPTRRLSAGSSAAGKGTPVAHRVSVRRLNARSRLGRPPPLVLSKAVQSLQMVRDDLAKLASSSCPLKPVNTISTQTLEQDEQSGSATSMISRRHSRIPVRQYRIKRDKERSTGPKEEPSGAVQVPEEVPGEVPEGLYSSYSKCNVFSVVTISVSASKLQTIESTSTISVSIKPNVEIREFCTVSQANVLACPEFKFKTVDVDTTLENWRPNLAELSIVTEPKKTTRQKRKVSSKAGKSKSRDKKGCWKKVKSRESVCSTSDKTGSVDSPDKEKSSCKYSSRRKGSDIKTSSRSKADAKSSASNDTGGVKSEGGISCTGTTSGSNCRVHFSPQLTSSCRPTTKATAAAADEGERGKAESVSSDKDSTMTVSKLPEIIKRVTDQAITSIAKSVMLGLPRQLPINTHQSTSLPTNRHSSTLLANSGSFQLSPRPQPPQTMSSLSINDDTYGLHRRNPSQLSLSSMLSSHTLYSQKASNRYKYRSSAPPLSKTRKDFDNRHSQTSTWKQPKEAWYNDSATDSDYLDDSRRYQSSSDRAAHSFTRGRNWMRPHSRKRAHKVSTADVSSYDMPSSSSIYIPEPMKYSRPSQRFSVKGIGSSQPSSMRSSRISRLDEHDLTKPSRLPMSSSFHHSGGFYGSSSPRRMHLRT